MNKFRKIDGKDIEDIIALTPMQEGMLFHYLREPRSDSYFQQLNLEILGEIDVEYVKTSWNFVIATNEMLRTVFRWEKLEHPIQITLKTHNIHLQYLDLSTLETNERQKRLEEIKMKDREEKFDLREVPFRVTLCRRDNSRYEMIISNHHIIYDGWSNGIILKEFFEAYDEICKRSPLIPTVKAKFKEFVKWIQNRDLTGQEKSWKNYLKGIDTPTGLSVKSRIKGERITKIVTETHQMKFEKTTAHQLEAFVKKHQITLASLLYCAWALLLQGYNNTNDVIFGTTVSGRSAGIKGIEHMVGLFINTLPLRILTNSHEKTIDLLHRIDNHLKTRDEHGSTSLVDIKKYNGIVNNEELFDSIVIIENYPLEGRFMLQNNSLVVKSFSMVEQTHYDLTVGITLFDDIKLLFQYNKSMLDGDIVRRMGHHLAGIIEDMTGNPAKLAVDLEIISPEEKKQILDEFNRTPMDYPKDKTVVQLFAEQVKRAGDRISLVGRMQCVRTTKENIHLSYKELEERTNRLAGVLRGKGVPADTIIGIMVQRSLEMVIGIFSILKAGGAYLPIDPEYPGERITYILADGKVKFLVTSRDLSKETKFEKEMIYLPDAMDCILTSTPVPAAGDRQLAYIIYTSGSTGKPKGVMVDQRSVVNLLFALQHRYPLRKRDTYLLKTSYLFDVSVTELFGWMLAGGRLAVLEKDGEKDPGKILAAIRLEEITHVNFVPSMFSAFTTALNHDNKDKLSSLQYIFLAGEALWPESVKRFRSLNTTASLENIYGPTEATVYASWYSLVDWNGEDSVPIGKPLPNTRLYILDKTRRLQPVGVPGELSISGVGLARGYLNQPELTAEKFCLRRPGGALFEKTAPPGPPRKNFSSKVPGKNQHITTTDDISFFRQRRLKSVRRTQIPLTINNSQLTINNSSLPPFTPLPQSPIYLTGDLARWLWDGNIEFLGRIDQQVKIRGFRIELGEIENQLLNHHDVKEVVVTAKSDGTGDRFLCAYIVPHRPEGFDILKLKQYLLRKVPHYMIPSYFAILEEIPLTNTGKIDRNALPQTGITGTAKYAEPRNEREKAMVKIWHEVLGVGIQTIGIDDNFFEIGGHSLKALRLTGRLSKEFNVEIPITTLFKIPTVRGLTGYMSKTVKCLYCEIPPVEKKEYYVLSSAQRRLFVLQQMAPDHTVYNMPGALVLGGKVEKDSLETIFMELIHRHESLRTSFEVIDDQPVQEIHEPGEIKFSIEYYDLQVTDAGDGSKNEGLENFIRPFDLSQAPLFRVGLIKEKELKYILMVDIHHIISDGTSTNLLIQEFMTLYKGEKLPVLRIQYKDFSNWRDNQIKSGKVKRQEAYWLKVFQTGAGIPVTNLPIDYKRPHMQNFIGDTLHFETGKKQTGYLKQLALKTGTTIYMILLAVFNVFISKLNSQEDIVVGSPVEGRNHHDLKGIIGMFVNTLALRNYPIGEKTFTGFLTEVKDNFLKALENQDYQYEELVEKVAVQRDLGSNPLFGVMLEMQHVHTANLDIPGLRLKPYDYENKIAKFDMTFTADEKEEVICFHVTYSTSLFKEATIRRFISYFKNILSSIEVKPGKKLSGIEIISREEKQRILYDFNKTGVEYPNDKTIVELFENQVKKTPHQLALVYKDKQLSYLELNARSNQLAGLLQQKGVGTNSLVGLMLGRSLEMVLGMMSVLKAGGAYLPIDVKSPRVRKDYMILESGLKLILVNTKKKEIFPGIPGEIERLNIDRSELNSRSIFSMERKINISDLAYIIYTSGSTGKPKGVLVEHGSVVNVINWFGKKYQLEPGIHVAQFNDYTFDPSVEQVFGTLSFGATLYILDGDLPGRIEELYHYIARNQIQMIDFVPTVLSELLLPRNKIDSLELVISGGEILTESIKGEILNKGYTLYNHYGPTETTVDVLSARCSKANVTLGKPIFNMKCYIFDGNMNLVPVGIAGELYIAGVGVARGYLNNPELTVEKFDHDLLEYQDYRDKRKKIPGKRIYSHMFYRSYRSYIYRSGDLARWQPDGAIEFLGRIDHQIKIRGVRIELGEIESQLLKHNKIKESVVIARKNEKGDRYLCTYIVPAGANEATFAGRITTVELRRYLLQKLPGYMVPDYFVRLDRMPLTPTGKIDREALPPPGLKPGELDGYTAPRDEREKKLVEIWSGVLEIKKEKIGINSDFFQLGGNSLKAAVMVSGIHKEFNVKVPPAEIFMTPTVRKLARYIKKSKSRQEKYVPIEPTEKKEYYALSSAQRRIYIMQQSSTGSIEFNMPGVFLVQDRLNRQKFQEIFAQLIRRHEVLRTSFFAIREQEVQKIHPACPFKFNHHTGGEAAELQRINRLVRPFDMSCAPLFRVELIQIEEKKYYIFIDMHHIVSDGSSTEILIREFLLLYKGRDLSPLPLQYKDYAAWQQDSVTGEKFKQQERYWLKKIEGFMFTQIPPDKLGRYKRVEGKKISLTIELPTYQKIEHFCHAYEVTGFIFMLTVFEIILAREVRQSDITIGIPVSVRDHQNLKNLMGIFLNILLIRSFIDRMDMFLEALSKNKQVVTEALNNRHCPYELLDLKIKEKYNLKRDEIFSVFFNYIPQQENPGIINDFKITAMEFMKVFPKYDMTLYILDLKDLMKLDLVYKANLYDESTAKSILNEIVRIVKLVLEDEHTIINDLNPYDCCDDERDDFESHFEKYYENEEFMS